MEKKENHYLKYKQLILKLDKLLISPKTLFDNKNNLCICLKMFTVAKAYGDYKLMRRLYPIIVTTKKYIEAQEKKIYETLFTDD